MRRPLYHLLYTSAPGAGGSGYRHVPVSFPAGGDPAPIQEWLETLQQVAPGANEGWAFHSFGIDRTPWAALAMVNPSFSPEEHGRGRTVLVHALLLPVPEGQRVDHFGLALFERAKSFLDGGRENYQSSLDWYLQGFDASRDLEIPEPDLRHLRDLEPAFLARLFEAASGRAGRVAFAGIESDDLLPERILLASAVLPPRLRLQMRWRVGFPSAPEGFAAFTGEGDAGPSPMGQGEAFGGWVERALQEQRFDAVRQLSENWAIRDWESLVQALPTFDDRRGAVAVAQPAVMEVVAETPVVSRDPEEAEMKRNPPAAGRGKPPAPRSGKSAEAWDEEYQREQQSLQKNLEEYVKQRFGHLGDTGGWASTAGLSGGEASPRGIVDRLWAWRPEIYLALVLALVLGLHRESWWPDTAPGILPPLGTQTPVPSPGPSPTPQPAPAPASTDPLEEWEIFVRDNRSVASAWFRALANRGRIETRQVNAAVSAKYLAWADRLERGEALAGTDRRESLIGMFEYVHARWAKENGRGNPGEDWVTLDPREADRNLPELLIALRLADQFGTKAQATDAKVQLAVVRTWLQWYPQP